jgi:hypothetical protein
MTASIVRIATGRAVSRFTILSVLSVIATLAASSFVGIGSPMQDAAAKEQLQAKIADVKASLAKNQEALRQYTWMETTEISLKGEVKSKTQNSCNYGPDGKVEKKLVSTPPEKKDAPRGLKGKIVENKVDDLKDYMASTAGLIKLYIPPDPAKMQAAFQAGTAQLTQPVAGKAMLTFSDYALKGDKFSLTFDTTGKKIVSVDVHSYLEKPDDVVTLSASFTSLPEGINYLSKSVLDATAKKVQVKTTNAGYKKSGQ